MEKTVAGKSHRLTFSPTGRDESKPPRREQEQSGVGGREVGKDSAGRTCSVSRVPLDVNAQSLDLIEWIWAQLFALLML